MSLSLRSLLLLSAATFALTLGACDDQDTTTPDTEQQSGAAVFMGLGHLEPEPSWAGSYLASRVAQGRMDWAKAEAFLTEVNTDRPNNLLVERRLMLLAAGSGDFDEALKQAHAVASKEDPTGLTPLILFMEPVRSGDYKAARAFLDKMPKNALSAFAVPVLSAWIAAGDGGLPVPLATQPGLYDYHRILIADYQGSVDNVATRDMITRVQPALTPIAAERLGDIFLRHHKYDLALDVYRLTEMMNPHVVGIQTKIKAAQDKNAAPAGVTLAGKTPDIKHGIATVFFDMGATFYNDQSFESALVFARMALALDPDMVEAKLLIGNLLADQDRKDAAIAIYDQIPETASRYMAVQQKIAALRVDLGQDDKAIETLRGLITKDITPAQKIDYLMQIGDIYREDEKFKDALGAYNDAFDIIDGPPSADHWDLLYARGMTLERLKQWDKAEIDLQTALKFQPDHPYILNYLGYSWADQGLHLQDAMKMLQKAAAIVPNDGYVTDSVGWVYYRQNDFGNAVKYLERAVELLPYDATVNDHLGDAYWQVGRKREARFQWQRAVNYTKDDAQKTTITTKIDAGL